MLNIIWFVFSGFWLWLAYMLAGLIRCVLIVTIPWGIASFRLANYAAWPFGREVIERPDAGVGSAIGNVVWVLVAGWWLALTHIVTGIALCVTIIGIPMGIANFKLIGSALSRWASRSSPAAAEPPPSETSNRAPVIRATRRKTWKPRNDAEGDRGFADRGASRMSGTGTAPEHGVQERRAAFGDDLLRSAWFRPLPAAPGWQGLRRPRATLGA